MADIEYALNTVERVRVEITSKRRTGTQLVALPVEIAVIPFGQSPGAGDWVTGAWEPSPGANKAVATAVHTFSTPGRFGIHSRIPDAPETVIKHAGAILVKN